MSRINVHCNEIKQLYSDLLLRWQEEISLSKGHLNFLSVFQIDEEN